ncbi:MAG: hypothetical protein FWC74_09465 [Candidatus Bathyarchaeota archaeon]|nr:hypothetical protein [Candidatus Termitimicrobium sp.]
MSAEFEEMKLGSAVKLNELVKVQGQVKESTNLEAGQFVCNNDAGEGFAPATTKLSETQAVFVVEHAHNYAEAEATGELPELKHSVALYAKGVVVAQKLVGVAMTKGQKLKVSATAGKATVVDDSADIVIGSVAVDAEAAAEKVIVRIGQ